MTTIVSYLCRTIAQNEWRPPTPLKVSEADEARSKAAARRIFRASRIACRNTIDDHRELANAAADDNSRQQQRGSLVNDRRNRRVATSRANGRRCAVECGEHLGAKLNFQT